MKKHIRLVYAAVIAGMLLLCLGARGLYTACHWEPEQNVYREPLAAAPAEADPLAHISEEFVVDEGFTSHLPIVVLDTGGVEPPIHSQNIPELHRFVAIEGVEPYVPGTMYLLDSASGENKLSDTPVVSSPIQIKRRGNTSVVYEKAQWLVKLQTQSGQDNDVDLLGMGAEHEWILNGSMADKSMLRNYLAFSTAAEMGLMAPESKYCEVLFRNEGTYTYQGVYLLCESIKQGPDRVDIQEYKQGQAYNSYLVRRDRYEEGVNLLENYGRLMGYSAEYLELLYPNRFKVTEEMTAYVQEDLNRIEQVLYSEDHAVFSQYPDLIDVDSFVDFFLVNEFFLSYDTGNYSTYFYKDLGGKLTMGPVWDFDGTMDNFVKEPVHTSDLAFQTKPWFDQLCRDKAFVSALRARYAELRNTTFSSVHVDEKIDSIIAHLGGAQEREWARWGHWYTQNDLKIDQWNPFSLVPYEQENGITLYRNANTYQEEISRVKTALYEHGSAMPDALHYLERTCTMDTGIGGWRGALLFLAAMVFLIPAYFVVFRK